MNRYAVFTGHLLYWVLYGCLCIFLLFLGRGGKNMFLDEDVLVYLFVCLLTAMLSFYPFYRIWFLRYLAQRKLKAFIIAGLLTGACVSLFITVLIIGILYYFTNVIEKALIWPFFIVFFLYSLVHGIAATGLRGFFHWYLELRAKEALQKKNLETELALLKGQLQPHFLFNTINNIDVLIGKDPAKASVYLQQLSGMLRYMLYKGAMDSIPLEEEIQFVRYYIELQKIRKTSDDWIKLEVEGDVSELRIAPLLFLPFIENALKHGVTDEGTEPILIQLQTKGRVVTFYCRNNYSFNKVASAVGNGLGLPLVRQRMELLYSGRYSLEVQALHNTFIVKCSINL
jgi:sensor histidine kinase YesM